MTELDNIIHQPLRLRIMSALVVLEPAEQMDFIFLRNLLKATDGNLGSHLAKLEENSYIKTEKTFIAPKTTQTQTSSLLMRSQYSSTETPQP